MADYNVPTLDSSSSTVTTKSLLLSLIIDAKEGRDVATADIVGAYLNALMEKFVLMKIEGSMIPFLIQADPDKCT